jgi:hypothetical protein
MKRIITCLLSAVVSLGAYAQFSDGFYRLKCKETGRYLTVHNNYVNKESAKSTGQVYLQSLQTIDGFDNIVNDPGSVIYMKKTSKGYIIESQGFTTEGRNLYLKFTKVNGAYRIYTEIIYDGAKYTRYLRDYEEKKGKSYIITDASKSTNWHWHIIPVKDADEQYMGLKGDVKVGKKYYTTFYATFPIKLGSGMKAYAVNTLTESTCTLKEIGNTVPEKTPVVIACAGEKASSNKVTPLTSGGSDVGTNKLSGRIFCYPVITPSGKESRDNPAWNAKDYKPKTMRLLGEADGKLAFITASDVKYLPANRAYLKVTSGSAASIPTDGSTDILKVTSNPDIPSQTKGTYTLNGVRLPDNITPQKGIYIKDGKKVVIK